MQYKLHSTGNEVTADTLSIVTFSLLSRVKMKLLGKFNKEDL